MTCCAAASSVLPFFKYHKHTPSSSTHAFCSCACSMQHAIQHHNCDLATPCFSMAVIPAGHETERWANHFDPYSELFTDKERIEILISDIGLGVVLSGLGYLWKVRHGLRHSDCYDHHVFALF